MTRLFRRWWNGGGAGREEREARDAERRGDFARAAALYSQAGQLDEAARMLVARGDAEPRAAARVRHYARAASTATEGSALQREAMTKRALSSAAAAAEASPTTAARRDLLEAARELESLGEHEKAAEAYARARDIGGQLRALELAGDIEGLESLLDVEHAREREARLWRDAAQEFSLLVSSGRRREAAALARSCSDPSLRDRGRDLEERRISRQLRATIAGKRMVLLLGERLVIGRAPESEEEVGDVGLRVPSAALSRRHLVVRRTGERIVVSDLGSRNGSAVRGAKIGEAPLDEGLEVTLGREVVVGLSPAPELPGAVAVEIGGSRYVAPIGPAWIGVGRWRLEPGADGWVDLVGDDDPPAFAGVLQWAARSTLVDGDALTDVRGGAPRLIVER
jgi:hypothetical protein